jgi:hypothetical protein
MVIKSRWLRWAGYATRMVAKMNSYRVLVGKPKGKRQLGRPRHRWEDYIKTNLRDIGCGGMDWIWLGIGTSGGLL